MRKGISSKYDLENLLPAYYEDNGDDVFERRDEETGEVKGYAFFNFISIS